jgi:hypothetical protein
MKVVIQSIEKIGDEPKYEIHMLIDGVERVGSLTREAKGPVWIFDKGYYTALQASPGAPRRISSFATDLFAGKKLTFPINLGDI